MLKFYSGLVLKAKPFSFEVVRTGGTPPVHTRTLCPANLQILFLKKILRVLPLTQSVPTLTEWVNLLGSYEAFCPIK